MSESCSSISSLLQGLSVCLIEWQGLKSLLKRKREGRSLIEWQGLKSLLKGKEKGEVGTPTERGEQGAGGEGEEATFTSTPPIPSQKALTCEGEGEEVGRDWEVGRGGKMAGRCGKVPVIVANPTVGTDGCRGQAICFRGGASQEEAPTYHGRQSPPEGIPPGW